MSSNTIAFRVRRVYMEHHTQCSNILNSSTIKLTPQLSLELYSVLYVISDYAAFGYEHTRTSVSDALLSKIISTLSMTYPQFSTDMLRRRVTFYSQVVGGLELHAHALMAKDVSEAHPVIRCCIAFSDCCLYPAYIENYNAARPMLSALDVMDFSLDVMQPLNAEFASLFEDICDICTSSAKDQSDRAEAKDTSVSTAKSESQIAPTPQDKTLRKTSHPSLLAIAILALFVFFFAASTFSLYLNNSELESEISTIRTEIANLENDLSALEAYAEEKTNELSKIENELSKIENEYSKYRLLTQAELSVLRPQVQFFDEYAAIVLNDGTRCYHRFTCTLFQSSEARFWIYNIDAAKGKGFTPCLLCIEE